MDQEYSRLIMTPKMKELENIDNIKERHNIILRERMPMTPGQRKVRQLAGNETIIGEKGISKLNKKIERRKTHFALKIDLNVKHLNDSILMHSEGDRTYYAFNEKIKVDEEVKGPDKGEDLCYPNVIENLKNKTNEEKKKIKR